MVLLTFFEALYFGHFLSFYTMHLEPPKSMPSPGQAWGTKAFLVDGAQAQPTGDEAFISRVEAVPMWVTFEPKEGTDQPVDGIDILSRAEIDHVVNYMRMGMHDRVAAKKRRAMVTSPHWWDDKMLVTGKYEKDEFVARVIDHITDQYDGPVGSDPPTWDFPRMGAGSDKNSADAANFRRLSVGSMPHDDEDGISDEEKSDSDPEEAYTAVRSVVLIPKQAAEEAEPEGRRADGEADKCLSAAIQWRRRQEPSRSWEFWHSEDQAEAEPQDLSSSGVPTSGRSGRGHEEVVGRVY